MENTEVIEEVELETPKESIATILDGLHSAVVAMIPKDSFLVVKPIGFSDTRKIIGSDALSAVGVEFKDMLELEALFELPKDFTKMTVIATELLKARGLIDQVEAENTPIGVIEAWTLATLIESSRFYESKQAGN